MTRRELLALSGATLAIRRGALAQRPPSAPAPAGGLPLEQYEPKSALHTKETSVMRARYPVIDFHTHLSFSGRGASTGVTFPATAEECLAVMDAKNLRTLVNLTGGYGDNLKQAIAKLQTAHPGRFVVFTEPAWDKASDPNYAQTQADLLQEAHRSGAKGLKVLKTLGLFLRERGSNKLVKLDDTRFDPMWETAGALKMPVAIHTSDPEAFFLPIDRFNERWEELHAHPDWSFNGKDFPSNRELQEARRNVMRRHPKTQFVCLHVADAEDLNYVSECMKSHPNMHVEIAARIGELGRQPRAARKFIDTFQDRVLFGTDAIPKGFQTPQQVFGEKLYEIYFRFLETEDEYFDYAPANVPPQGRWRISGVGLNDSTLRKIYQSNAERLLAKPASA